MINSRPLILADEMGLGKVRSKFTWSQKMINVLRQRTLQTIAFSAYCIYANKTMFGLFSCLSAQRVAQLG